MSAQPTSPGDSKPASSILSNTGSAGAVATPAVVTPSAPLSSPPTLPPSINLLILITGSVAAIKTGLLLDQLRSERCHVRIAATQAAFHFLHRAQPSKTGIPFQSILTDEQEWDGWQALNDSIIHIELRRWADLVVIAPLDANTLAKIATGQCNNLVTSVMRAWETREKPVIVCPAMNTAMWQHPITAEQIGELAKWYSATGEAVLAQPVAGGGANAQETQAEAPVSPPPVVAAAAAAATVAAPGEEKKPEDAEPQENVSDVPALIASSSNPLPPLASVLFQVVGPVTKKLACGDIGIGGMASVEDIAKAIKDTMAVIRAEKVRNGLSSSGVKENTDGK